MYSSKKNKKKNESIGIINGITNVYMILLCTKIYQNWSMNIEDIADQTSVIFEHD